MAPARLPEVASVLLRPFVEGDAIAGEIAAITREAFDFPAPLVPVTLAVACRCSSCFTGPPRRSRISARASWRPVCSGLRAGAARPLNILVATSGDTGGAVAAAFHRRPGVVVSVLFPKGLVSPTQERQLTCWGDNVHSFRVNGSFDDCQRLVKEAFVDAGLRARFELSSANSINLGRLLPQAVYYAATSLAVHRAQGVAPNFIIPSGNLGNSVACVWARKLGLPIGRIVLAHNANRTVPDFLANGEWRPRASVPTLASAMDVGSPSNMERLRALFPDLEAVRGAVSAHSVTDAADPGAHRRRISASTGKSGARTPPRRPRSTPVCQPAERANARWIMVSTAHPAKFREIVEPLIGRRIEMPESLAKLFARPVSCDRSRSRTRRIDDSSRENRTVSKH